MKTKPKFITVNPSTLEMKVYLIDGRYYFIPIENEIKDPPGLEHFLGYTRIDLFRPIEAKEK